MEDVPIVERKSAAHEACERIFTDHQRMKDGKFVVRLQLMAGGPEKLGNSEIAAHASLASLHRHMRNDPQFAAEYRSFMEEYIRLGHMRLVPDHQLQSAERPTYYIPHHGIWQQSDNGAKLKVVFNASRPTTSGHSLNDVLYPGPKLQTDIWLVIIRWMSYKIAFCTDICMMFRQIWVDSRDTDLQRVLWSSSQGDSILHYQLLTVTYGTTSAPYLSLRVLQQLVNDKKSELPEAAEAAARDRYVDDILSGAHKMDDALRLRDQLIQLMESGGFPLQKCVANRPELLQGLDESHCLRSKWIMFTADNPVRELGIVWDPQKDSLGVKCPSLSKTQQSKRHTLSVLASTFDPCGWFVLVTLVIKLLLQDLWRAKLEWDEELSAAMKKR